MTAAFGIRRWGAAVLLTVAVALAYANSLRTPLLFDDVVAVVDNPTIRRLASWEVLRPPADGGPVTGRPVVNATLAINHAVSGDRAWSYHALNLAIHALCALLLLGVLRRTLVRVPWFRAINGAAPSAATTAFFIALLWALHPLQTETVVGIAQRTESLCGLFYLATLYGFIRADAERDSGGRSEGRAWLTISVLSCLVGMATKEVMVTAPVFVLLYDRTFAARSFGAALRRHPAYYAALAGTWLLLGALLTFGHGTRGASAGFGLGITAWQYLLQQSVALTRYVCLAFWPYPLVVDYGRAVPTTVADVAEHGIVVLSLVGVSGWLLVRRRIAGFLAVGFFLLLAPSSSFVPLVTQGMAEHRMYLPLALVICGGVAAGGRYLGFRITWLLSAAALAFAAVTAARNRDYRDPIVLWADNVAKHPAGARGHNNLAAALQAAGRIAEASVEYERALALDPDYVTAHYNFGALLLAANQPATAADQFAAALRLAPEHAAAELNLGVALVRSGRTIDAVRHFATAARLGAGADAHYNLGIAYLVLDDDTRAAAEFRAAKEIPDAHYQLGRLAERAGNPAAAEVAYGETLAAAPGHAAAHAGLGLLLARSNRLDAAEQHLRTAVRLQPDDVKALANLGQVLLLERRPAEAVTALEAATRLRPGDAALRGMLEEARRMQ